MSLKNLAGQTQKATQKVQRWNTSLGNAVSTKLLGNSSFLRNESKTQDDVTSISSGLQQGFNSLGSQLGVKDNKYIIGRIEENLSPSWLGNNAFARAVSSGLSTLSEKGQTRGVIIDGYDDMVGELTVGLPSQPVMYSTEVINQRVRNPDTFKMRIYVTNLNSDDIVDSLGNSLMNMAGGVLKMALNPESRAFKALNDLKWLQENGKPFKIYTPIRVYENMLIEKISPISNKSNYDTLVADVYFREIVFSQSLGNASKSSARKPPSEVTNTFAKTLGWFGLGGK